MRTAVIFMSGMLTCGYAVAALYFVRFWRQTRDRLFACFALAFLLLAVHRALITLFEPSETMFVVRLAAFLVILYAIWEKNRS
jgi:hypothetical protein